MHNTMKKFLKPVLTLFVTASMLVACKRDEDPQPPKEQELITNITLTLIDIDDPNPDEEVTATFRDPDGPGGQAPTITPLVLKPNRTYWGSIRLLNDSDPNDVKDITEEVEAELDDHEFFFTPSPGLNLTIRKTDSDSQGRPVGLETDFDTGAVSSGILNVKLMHQAGIKPTPGSANVGETDIDIDFITSIEE